MKYISQKQENLGEIVEIWAEKKLSGCAKMREVIYSAYYNTFKAAVNKTDAIICMNRFHGNVTNEKKNNAIEIKRNEKYNKY